MSPRARLALPGRRVQSVMWRGLTACWLLCGLGVQAQRAATYRVIVNVANPVSTLSRDDISRLFLKKVTRWSGGGEVVPVDLPDDSPLRRTFTREIHKRDLDSVNSYWQQVIFAGRGLPPAQKPSDGEVLAFVASHPGAIGYVSAGLTLTDQVKIVEVSGE